MIKNRVIPILWGDKHRTIQYVSTKFKDRDQESTWLLAGHQNGALTIESHAIKKPYSWMEYLVDYFPDLENISFCFSRFVPGTYFPMHVDRYGFYAKNNGIVDLSHIGRYILFIEDAAPGHFLQIDDKIYHNWPAGFCVGWRSNTPHLAANLGLVDRYTLQITGTLRSKYLTSI